MRSELGGRVLGTGLAAGMALTAVLLAYETPGAQSIGTHETTRSVRNALERLPYYGVFDFMAFGVDRGTVTLTGYAYRGSLRSAAENATKRASGVDEVANKLEVLPASPYDDRIRWATFYKIYTDSFLSRYAPGGAPGALREAFEARSFPGLQPFGTYPIHIIVKSGRTTLVGVVDNRADRQIAEMRAREVSGVFEVINELVVGNK
jgi:hyperosmotically inducible periplasmic protein